jgi:hypothetical protein
MATPGPDCDGCLRLPRFEAGPPSGFAHQWVDAADGGGGFIEYSFALVARWSLFTNHPMSPPMNHNNSRIGMPACARVLMLSAALIVVGCASKPGKVPAVAAAPAPAVQSLQQYMQDAARAASEGNNKERARELYRTAARQYPASKEPWLKLAEDYFESANYGQAILAAQEVTQRDPQDSVATSVLAVSGLRVSAAALGSMRTHNSQLTGGNRSEAQALTKTLRDALGETELVPQAAAPGGADAAGKAAAAKPAARPPVVRRVAAPASAPAAADDPFKILKK